MGVIAQRMREVLSVCSSPPPGISIRTPLHALRRSCRFLEFGRAQSMEEERIAQPRIALRMLAHGVTTCEVKSGYGLETETELKMLRVVRRVDSHVPVRLVPTFLGAHAVPEEHREHPERYVDIVCEEMIPAVVEILDNESIYVSAPLDEVDVGRVRVGQPVRVTLDAYAAAEDPMEAFAIEFDDVRVPGSLGVNPAWALTAPWTPG